MIDSNQFVGNERMYPSSSNPCKYTLDRIREEIILFSKRIKVGSTLLDFGCGEKPYYPLFKDKVSKYIGLDVDDSPEKNKSTNVIIKQGDKLPFPKEHFDAIISTQVFEHIKDINFYSKELKRVLKKGGRMFISAAFCWDYHPYPQDFWRITEEGYRSLFTNFSEISFEYDTNTVQTILQMTNLLLSRKNFKLKILYKVINYIISKIDFKNGDQKCPGNIFVSLKK